MFFATWRDDWLAFIVDRFGFSADEDVIDQLAGMVGTSTHIGLASTGAAR
jgi:hypothetical protein